MPGTHLWAALEEALARPPEQRQPYLAERLAPEDARRAAELLEQVEAADGFFDDLARDVEPARVASVRRHEVERTPVPERIGPYRIVQRRGVGGMGEVYRAERADGAFEQTVAIKLIRRSLEDEVSIERFRAERQILAQLEHPNIARLIDGGVTEDGRTYLVMEWVDGQPIDRWAADRQLGKRDRIRLFVDVCRAVEHAHRNLVIHRDLKPSNVLVDPEGRIKLLDFGIAKILSPEVGSRGHGISPSVTATARQTLATAALTPRYAAPEQINGQLVSTATDVYALGVVLYEILTGASPFGGESRDRDRPEAIVRPSRRTRETAPGGLRPRDLRGDLDAIVLACLESDPRQRTSTVQELRQDLERHLASRPVLVRRPNLAMRVDRFVRRNLASTIVTLVAVVALAWAGFRLGEQYRATVSERDKAQAASDILIDMFRSSDPLRASEGPPTATEVLARGRERLEQLDDQPELQADLANVLGEVYRNVGLHDQALELHARALAVHLGQGESGRAQVQRTLALQADALRLGGDLEEALDVAREALDLAVGIHGLDSLQTARVRSLVGRIHLSRRELVAAQQLLQEAVAVQTAPGVPPDLDLATTLNDLAVSHILSGDTTLALPLLRRAIGLRSELLGAEHPSIAGLENNLAALLSGRAQFAEAEQIYRRLVPQLEERLGRGHVHAVNARRNLGLAMLQQGRAEESLRHLEAALNHAQETLGSDHPLAVVLTNYVGFAHLEADDLAAAEAALRRAIEAGERIFGADDPRQAAAVHNLALVAERRGELEQAERGLRRALTMGETKLPNSHPQILATRSNLARIEHALGRLESAQEGFESVLEQQRVGLPEGHPDLAYTLLGLASLRAETGDADTARRYGQEALELIGSIYPDDHRLVIEARRLVSTIAR